MRRRCSSDSVAVAVSALPSGTYTSAGVDVSTIITLRRQSSQGLTASVQLPGLESGLRTSLPTTVGQPGAGCPPRESRRATHVLPFHFGPSAAQTDPAAFSRSARAAEPSLPMSSPAPGTALGTRSSCWMLTRTLIDASWGRDADSRRRALRAISAQRRSTPSASLGVQTETVPLISIRSGGSGQRGLKLAPSPGSVLSPVAGGIGPRSALIAASLPALSALPETAPPTPSATATSGTTSCVAASDSSASRRSCRIIAIA